MHDPGHAAPAPEITLDAVVAAMGRASVNLRVGVFNHGNRIALAGNTMVFIPGRAASRRRRHAAGLAAQRRLWRYATLSGRGIGNDVSAFPEYRRLRRRAGRGRRQQ